MFEKLAHDIYNAAIVKLAAYDYANSPHGKLLAEEALREIPKTLKYVESLRADPKTDPALLKFHKDNIPYLTELQNDAKTYLATLK